jgi:predicted amidophosphoribosyltransferase
MFEELVALLVPPLCAACRGRTPRATVVLCADCRRALPWLPEDCCPRCALPHAPQRCPARGAAFGAAWAAVAYEGVARQVLHALKFGASRPLADVMAAHLAAGAPPGLLRGAVVAVPAHPVRRRARGFDPAQLIAVALARRTRRPLVDALARGRSPARQLGASREVRRAAGRLDIRARGPGPAPERVVLVDDVHTTGATLDACATALRNSGSRHIVAITWARTLDVRPVEAVA